MKKQGQKPKLPKRNDKPQFENLENERSKRAKINLREKPKKRNDNESENLLLLTGNERLEEDILDEPIKEVKDLFKKQNEENLEKLRQANEDMKEKHGNEIVHLKKEHEKEVGSL